MLSKGCGYKKYFFAKEFKSFKKKFKKFYTSPGPSFFEIIVDPGTFENLIRPNDLKKIVKDFHAEKLTIDLKPYYFSNIIARCSKTMIECNNSKLNFKSTGTEG